MFFCLKIDLIFFVCTFSVLLIWKKKYLEEQKQTYIGLYTRNTKSVCAELDDCYCSFSEANFSIESND